MCIIDTFYNLSLVNIDLEYGFNLLRTKKVLSAVALVTGIVKYKQSMACTSLNIVLATGVELKTSHSVRMLVTSLMAIPSGFLDLMRSGIIGS